MSEQIKKRTFKKFTYSGVALESLLDLKEEQLISLLRCRARRKLRRETPIKHVNFLKKCRASKAAVTQVGEKPALVKTHARNILIVPEMIGSVIGIYNGKVFNQVEVKPEMIGHYTGEFSLSYKSVNHGRKNNNNNSKKLKSEDGCVIIQCDDNNNIETTSSSSSTNNIELPKIPQFYFPKSRAINDKLETSIFTIKNRFQTFKSIDMNQQSCTNIPAKYISSFDEFEVLIKDLHSFPRILNRLLFIYTLKQLKLIDAIYIPQDAFIEFWKTYIYGKDAEDLLFNILKKSEDSNFLFYEDFFLFSKTLIDFHPGLEFLSNTPEFQDRYQETIIIRIFYGTCRNRGRITAKDLKTNNFIRSLSLLDAEPDINKHLEYFSYEHFYVIYCKFWELDMDHDLFIDSNDLAKYGSCSLTPLIIERIIANSIFTKPLFGIRNKISYQDFVWFILSEEDKTSETSIEFWFSCCDLDCDGFLSLYEMDTFYKEQKQRLDYLNLDPPVFKDLLCQILDMIKPEAIEKITLLDLKSSKMAGYLFNVLFNINKFLQQESKESITCNQPMSDWNRFALQEYERALAEESLSYQDDEDDQNDDQDDDDQDDDDQDGHHHNQYHHQDNRMLIG